MQRITLRTLFSYWLPVVVWMAIIFSASSDSGSFQHTSQFIEPLLRWLFPNISDPSVHTVVVLVRKCAHLTEYAFLSLLLWRAIRQPVRRDPRPWNWPVAGAACAGVLLYSATDEFHQTFVPSRQGSIWDVLLDTLGGAIGILVLWAVGKLLKHW